MVKWIDENHWVCDNHFSSVKMYKSVGQCEGIGCTAVRPRKSQLQMTLNEPYCAWFKCRENNGFRAFARKGSKYCNDKCRKAFARHRYKEKKRIQKSKV